MPEIRRRRSARGLLMLLATLTVTVGELGSATVPVNAATLGEENPYPMGQDMEESPGETSDWQDTGEASGESHDGQDTGEASGESHDGQDAGEASGESHDDRETDGAAGDTGAPADRSHGMGYNHTPEEEEVESITAVGDGMEDEFAKLYLNERLPAKYTTPSQYIPALRNQGGYETCWAHVAMAAAEISMLKQGLAATPDYSELHLAYFTYNSPADPTGGMAGDVNQWVRDQAHPDYLMRGGNLFRASNILASWIGAADEAAVPYTSADEVLANGLSDNIAFSGSARLKNCYIVDISASEEDRNAVKRIIRDCGAAGTAYYSLRPGSGEYYHFFADNAYIYGNDAYSAVNNCYYFPHAIDETNHSVTLVGWDDSFSRKNFVYAPEGDGAWLVRNSWRDGGAVGDQDAQCYEGYFWLSYYDKSLVNSSAFGFIYDKSDRYDHNYQYDGGFYTNYTYSKTEGTGRLDMANVFGVPADGGDQVLEAVSFMTLNTNLAYHADIYLNPTDPADPESGELCSAASGTTTCEGYYTVALNRAVPLTAGDRFSVVISLVKNGETLKAAREGNYVQDWYKTSVSASAGQSFVRLYNGTGEKDTAGWEDVSLVYNSDCGNVRIKAFTTNETSARYTVTFDANDGAFDSGRSVSTKRFRAETAYGKLPVPGRKGYFFDGWYTAKQGGTRIKAETVASGDITCFAHWISRTNWVKKNPVWNDNGTVTYDCVWLGNYWQSDTNWDGSADTGDDKEPVKWRILSSTKDDLFLISDKILDAQQYHTQWRTPVTWETSTVRSWLNGYGAGFNAAGTDYTSDSFIDSIFSSQEKAGILISHVDNSAGQGASDGADGGKDTSDRLYLLSYGEAMTREAMGFTEAHNPSRWAKPTAYAAARGVTPSEPVYGAATAGNGRWWLRSPGQKQDQAIDILFNGSRWTEDWQDTDTTVSNIGVRPVLHISPTSPYLSPAGTVCSDGTVDEKGPGNGAVETVPVTGISLPEKKSVETGKTLLLKPVIRPFDATDQSVRWKSGNPSVALVDGAGLVTGVSEGVAQISATTTDGGFTAVCQVTVKNDLSGEDTEITLIPGEVRRLSIRDDGRYLYGVRWILESAKPAKCVTVKNGVVTAADNLSGALLGTARIRAVYGTEVRCFTVQVDGTMYSNIPISDGGRTCGLNAPKTLNLTVGTAKKINITIPKKLRNSSKTVSSRILTEGVCSPAYNAARSKSSRACFDIIPISAGASWIEWSLTDDGGNQTKAYTRVIVKKPVTAIHIAEKASEPLVLNIGEGLRLNVTADEDSTDARDLSFSVKGKGVRVSKSGYIVATASTPGSSATVTVRSGKVQESVLVIVSPSDKYMTLNKNSVTLKQPKPGKTATSVLKITTPRKRDGQPGVVWAVTGDADRHPGVTVTADGVVTIDSSAQPGCYEVSASPADPSGGYGPAFCEVIVK